MTEARYDFAEVAGYVTGHQQGEEGVSFSFPADGEGDLQTVITKTAGSSSLLGVLRRYKGAGGTPEVGLEQTENAWGELVPWGTAEDGTPGLAVSGYYDPVERTWEFSLYYAFRVRGAVHGRYWYTAGNPPRWEPIDDEYESVSTGNVLSSCSSAEDDATAAPARRSLSASCRLEEPDHTETLTLTLTRLR